MIAAVMTGTTMSRGEREQPDHAGEQEQRADQQPRHETQIAEPLGDGEDAGELVGVDLHEGRLAVRRTAAVLMSAPLVKDARPSHACRASSDDDAPHITRFE